jgi:hypothetical protein
MRFEPANEAIFEVEDFPAYLDSWRSNALFMAALQRAFAHTEIICGLSFRHTTKSRLDCHLDYRGLLEVQMKQPGSPPSGRSYARVLREL